MQAVLAFNLSRSRKSRLAVLALGALAAGSTLLAQEANAQRPTAAQPPVALAPGCGVALDPTPSNAPRQGRGYVNCDPGATLRVCYQLRSGPSAGWSAGMGCVDHANMPLGSIRLSSSAGSACSYQIRSVVSYRGIVANPSAGYFCNT